MPTRRHQLLPRRRKSSASASFRLAVEALESRTVLSATHLLAQAMLGEPVPGDALRGSSHADPGPGWGQFGAPSLQTSPRAASEDAGRHSPGKSFGAFDLPGPGGGGSAASAPGRGPAGAADWIVVPLVPPPEPPAARSLDADGGLAAVNRPASSMPALEATSPPLPRGSDVAVLPPARPWETEPAPLVAPRPRDASPSGPPSRFAWDAFASAEPTLRLSPGNAGGSSSALRLVSPPGESLIRTWEDPLSPLLITPQEPAVRAVGRVAERTGQEELDAAEGEICRESDDEGGGIELGDLGEAMRRPLLPPALRRESAADETVGAREEDESKERLRVRTSLRDEVFDERRLQEIWEPQLEEDRLGPWRADVDAAQADVAEGAPRDAGHDEGGTIELAVAAYSTAARLPAEPPRAGERALGIDPARGGGVGRIPMDAGVGLFQAFELAAGPGEVLGQPAEATLDQLAPGGAPATATAAVQVAAEAAQADVGNGTS